MTFYTGSPEKVGMYIVFKRNGKVYLYPYVDENDNEEFDNEDVYMWAKLGDKAELLVQRIGSDYNAYSVIH
jgi:hypothetical protein